MNGHAATSPEFRALFEAAPNLYLVLNRDLVIVAASDSYCQATMTVREEILGRGIFDVFPDNPTNPRAKGVSVLRASLERVIELRRPDSMHVGKFDIQRPASEGGGFEERYWRPLNVPVFDRDGEVAWIIHRVEDVTDLVRLKEEGAAQNAVARAQADTIEELRTSNRELAEQTRANEELTRRLASQAEVLRAEIAHHRETEAKLREASTFVDAVIEHLPGLIVVKDAKDLRFMLLNRGGEECLGFSRQEVIGKRDHDFFPSELADAYVARDREVLSTGKTLITREEQVKTRHHGMRTFKTTKLPVIGDSGEAEYLLCVSEDITEKKALEQQLVQAQKMEAIGNLTGGMAHDFNNLIGIIVGNLDLLEPELKSRGDLAELLKDALHAAIRGADLIRRLLAFARRQPLKPERINPNELVASMVKLLSRTLGEQVEVSLNLSTSVGEVVVDPAQLETSILNLATNSRDAMPKGGRLIIATSERSLDADYSADHPEVAPGDYVVIEVSDNGAGMPADIQSRVFEPFFTTKELGKGTGLGLSMVFGFMKQSGGHINVYSEVGVGTAIRLFLPRAKAKEVENVGMAAGAKTAGGEETVLVVEDNPGMRRVVVRQLKELGYQVLESHTGAAALEVLAERNVDLLFTDVVMPGEISGIELARRVAEQWPGLKIVLTSGFPEARFDGAGSTLNGLRLLSKPYRRDDLARALREAFAA